MALFLIVALIITILAGIFAVHNANPVTVIFLLWKFEGSLALVLLVTFIAGTLVGLLVLIPAFVRDKWTASVQRKRIEELEKNLRLKISED